ncbi:serine/threonine protein kinase [Brevibacillus nitrificans]|uniref:mitogen-activated protein kinase kinase n=1 Tax=Brevibacillus nitrificans TaxID=651560 RepID=A0A3M8D3E3_9BACL|nr:serine/threonine-protein kinase [Brevibacillus nitrificans]RNB82111.1 serine/threonine protein kinase [Brevibacillus nitrificans]
MIILPNSFVYDSENHEYKVIEPLGNGAFGYVYKIQKQSDNSIWALKTLPSNFPSQEQLHAFINESSMALNVNGDNTVKYVYIHDGSTYPQLPPYIIMEFANGGTLFDLIEKAKNKGEFFSNSELLNYFNQLINGMEQINTVLVHRDIKPDNILLNEGVIKISDFGLSKVVHDSTRQLTFKGFGALKYMAPEGWKNEKNTIQMDIYAMGITFFELATLQHPYNLNPDADLQQWQRAHLFNTAPSPKTINNSVNITIAQVILKMMEKSVSKRYKTWDEIRRDLMIQDLPVTKNTEIIENMVNIRLAKDRSISEQQLKEKKEREERTLYLNTINYQYANDIYNPLKEFIDEFNSRYTQGKITISSLGSMETDKIITKIHLTSGNVLTISLNALFDENFIRDVSAEFSFPGENRTFKRVVRPVLNNKKVQAWGYLKDHNNKGFNILLVENPEDSTYGEWFILKNTNSGFGRTNRPEPFPFEFNELEKELPLIRATHIYNTEVIALNLQEFYEFIVSNV